MATIHRGIKFPFSRSASGLPAASGDADVVGQSIRQLIMTTAGERVMRPTLGSSVFGYVFENNDEFLSDRIRLDIGGLIGRFEPRALVQGIDIERDVEASELIITVRYFDLTTQQTNSTQIRLPF